MTGMADAALAHVRNGRPVFPCRADKRPYTRTGFKEATDDEEKVASWWKTWPAALIGMPTGAASGLIAVDIDVKDGALGEESLDALEARYGKLPDTVESLTPSGGRHLLFSCPAGGRVRNSAGKLGPGIDIRGDGGYIILPPSQLPDGRSYQWEGSSDPDEGAIAADPPAWLLGLIWEKPAAATSADTDHEAREKIGKGARNDVLFRLASSLRAKGLTGPAILAALREENASRCSPPLSDEELSRIAGSAAQYEQGDIAAGGGVANLDAARAAKAARAKKAAQEAQGRIGGLAERYTFIKEQNQWLDHRSGIFLCRDALNSAHLAEFNNPKASTALLAHPKTQIVDSVTWMPEADQVVETDGRLCVNTWRDDGIRAEVGNIAPWIEHAEWLIPDRRERNHLFDWLAFTLQFQARKINHQIVFGGAQRIGKDTLIQPLVRALGSNAVEPQAGELSSEFNDYLDRRKLIVVQEIHTFQRRDIENKLKPICAAPPDTLRINTKGLRQYTIPNLVSVVFMTNHRADALSISGDDGRYFCLWSPVTPRETEYYANLYRWMNAGGDRAVVQFLRERDLSRFQPGASPPYTEWKALLQRASVPRLEHLLAELIAEEDPPFDKDIVRISEITKAHPALALSEGILHVALANLGAVRRRCVWRSTGAPRSITRHLWIIRNRAELIGLSDTELGRRWERGGGIV